jgi:hypothetical protein
MVIVRILGGLGNQMFQYAAGRSLALRLGESLRLDLSGFQDYALHGGYQLHNVFGVQTESASLADVESMLGWRSRDLALRWLQKRSMAWLRGNRLVAEPSFHYWQGWTRISTGCYLSGYWQSPRYFLDYEAQLRDDFSFREAKTPLSRAIARAIERTEAVAVHVRRGDYVQNPAANRVHGVCTNTYYAAAQKYVASRLSAPRYFVFSDDMAWVRGQSLFPRETVYVDLGPGQIDIQLMARCRHQIIANSTYSWWAAWLNPNPCKIVIAPRRWFSNGLDAADLVPASWVRF